MDRQLSLGSDDSDVAVAFKQFHDTIRDSKRRAVSYQEAYGSTAGNPLIKIGSNLLGKAAGMIDKMRNNSASKALRDDYTAYKHVAISYTMLYATALGMGDDETRTIAQQGITTYAGMVQEINQLIAKAVLADAQANDKESSVDQSVESWVRSTINETWKTTQSA